MRLADETTAEVGGRVFFWNRPRVLEGQPATVLAFDPDRVLSVQLELADGTVRWMTPDALTAVE